MRLILINMMALFSFSFVLHIFSLGIIRLGVFGINLKLCLDKILSRYINYIPIFSFIVFILLEYYLSNNVIFLDSKNVIVNINLDKAAFIITGDVLNLIFENLGGATVFAASARIAAGLLIKHPIGVFPKTGIIGGISAGYTVLYKMTMENMVSNISNSSASISSRYIHIKLETVTNQIFDGNNVNSLINSLGLSNMSLSRPFNFTESSTLKNIILKSQNSYSNSQIITALDQQNPSWRDLFIGSPLEETLITHIINVLNNNLLLHFIILYLLIMLLIIITCKFIIKDNIDLNNIKNNPLGIWVKYIINKFISIWKVSSNLWIFFILFNVIVFNSASIYSIYNLLLLFK